MCTKIFLLFYLLYVRLLLEFLLFGLRNFPVYLIAICSLLYCLLSLVKMQNVTLLKKQTKCINNNQDAARHFTLLYRKRFYILNLLVTNLRGVIIIKNNNKLNNQKDKQLASKPRFSHLYTAFYVRLH